MQKYIFFGTMKKPENRIVKICSFSVGAFILFSVLLISCGKGTSDEFSVMTGSFKQSVIETGELEAVNARLIVMARINWQYGYQFKIIGLAEHGKKVHKGDSVVAIDPASIYKFIIDREAMLDNELAASKKMKVQMENNSQDLLAQLKSEQAAFDLKKLEMERIQFESDNKRKIKELEFKQSEIRLNKVKRNIELRPKLDNLDSKIQRIKVIQRETELKDAKATLPGLVLRSPLDGIFQVTRSIYTGQNVRLGDNAYQGSTLASIPDITKMKAKTYINETDIRKVFPGMKVIVRLDALPSVPFHGKITQISKICSIREREKVFNTEVVIEESDLRLKPGMTVSCEYICFEADSASYVPNKCLLKEQGHSFVYVGKRGSARKVEVSTGPSNSYYTLITSDLKPGQRLVPFETVLAQEK